MMRQNTLSLQHVRIIYWHEQSPLDTWGRADLGGGRNLQCKGKFPRQTPVTSWLCCPWAGLAALFQGSTKEVQGPRRRHFEWLPECWPGSQSQLCPQFAGWTQENSSPSLSFCFGFWFLLNLKGSDAKGHTRPGIMRFWIHHLLYQE